MKTFVILCLGQVLSSIGSGMTYFSLTIWVWQKTNSAASVALILVFYQLPQIIITPLSGVLPDHFSHKKLLIGSDLGSALCTFSVGILAFLQILDVKYIYLIASIIGCFGNLQTLSYITLIPLIVPSQHHARVSSMGAIIIYSAGIVAPALAGILFPVIGLTGITIIDMTTFTIAAMTILILPMAFQIKSNKRTNQPLVIAQLKEQLIGNIIFGFKYIYRHSNLSKILIIFSLFSFVEGISDVIYQPMILAKTGGNTELLGIIVALGGVGGILGGTICSIWGGFKKRTTGIFAGFVIIGFSRLVMGLIARPQLWLIANFGASLPSPLITSSYMAIWYKKVAQEIQGRVLAVDYLIGTVISSLAGLAAGILANRALLVLTNLNDFSILPINKIFGPPPGSGMALLMVFCGVIAFLLGLWGLLIYQHRDD
ncbi:MFS transporter [Synechocystis salina LEGE 06099]|uniref:MFS transporter n=1 Tax=Synechocystis salina TaxID=945780 RepID=UPI00187E551C|nr:MFS transporter [Synechocystis salina]MBE9204560.1 MFS transporter [Synechocystis salina LEGE 06099]